MAESSTPILTSGIPLLPSQQVTYRNVNESQESDEFAEFDITKAGKLYARYIREFGFGKFSIDAYSEFLDDRLGKLIAPMVVEGNYKDQLFRYRLQLKEVSLPKTADGNALYPHEARITDKSYSGAVICYLHKYLVSGNDEIFQQTVEFKLAELPIMTGCSRCYLSSMGNKELQLAGECPKDPLGGFIIDGTRRILLLQEMLQRNRHFLHMNPSTGYPYLTLISDEIITSNAIELNFSIVKKDTKNEKRTPKTYHAYRQIPGIINMYSSRHASVTPVFLMMRFILESFNRVVTKDVLMSYVLPFIPQRYMRNCEALLAISLEHAIKSHNPRASILRDYNTFKVDPKEKRRGPPKLPDDIDEITLADKYLEVILSHYDYDWQQTFGPDGENDKINAKFYHLGFLISQLLLCRLGVVPLSNKDQWKNKLLRPPARTVEDKFRRLLAKFMDESRKHVNMKAESMANKMTELGMGIITKNLIHAFKNNSWSLKTKGKSSETIAALDEYISLNYRLSKLTEIAPPMDKRSRAKSKARDIAADSWELIDFLDSPDTEANGLVKHLAALATISRSGMYNILEYNLLATIQQAVADKEISLSLDPEVITDIGVGAMPFIFNGRYLGFTNGADMKAFLRSIKLGNWSYREICVVISDGVCYLDSSPDRPTRPMLIVENGQPVFVKDMKCKCEDWNTCECVLPWENMSFKEMYEAGYIEYLSAWDMDFFPDVLIASSMDDIRARQLQYNNLLNQIAKLEQDIAARKTTANTRTEIEQLAKDQKALEIYKNDLIKSHQATQVTHLSFHPSSYLGYSTGTLPMPERSPASRVIFGAGQQRNALSSVTCNPSTMWQTTFKSAVAPANPLTNTILGKMIYEDMGYGDTVTLALMPWRSATQEDACVVNRRAIDMGLFMYQVRSRYDTTLLRNDKFKEKIANPLKIGRNKASADKYANLDDDGMPIMGSYMTYGDCVIGKVRYYHDGRIEDASEFLKTNQEGLVEDYLSDSKREIFVSVRLVETRRIGESDKIATRNSQKMTIGYVDRPDDMPYINSGPNKGGSIDIIVNPHCMSRMTMGILLEILLGIGITIDGRLRNVHAYEPVTVDGLLKALPQYGFNMDMVEVVDGLTGEKLTVPIFVGPCFFMELGHFGFSKIQGRTVTGKIKEFTRAPAGGPRESGIRFGDQERSAAESHGAVELIDYIFHQNSDKFPGAVCKVCGSYAIPDAVRRQYKCMVCRNKDQSKFEFTSVPGALNTFKTLQTMVGIGIKGLYA